ncbi:hypothetical protein [Natronococcus wangiae]|uniref:hypothetical protein n=1 Tax=Natronococcus wangiae TaxID=3068275 RepID=UPI00273F0894|nr:hypothetical protein [Natronococcus sp. AD5]
MVADLLTYIDGADAADWTLTESQVWGLRQGVQAAVERGDESLSLPSSTLSAERWHHWGIGISVWLHESGVVILQNGEETIVTDVSMLEHVSGVLAGAHGKIGRVTRINPDRGDE